MSSTLTALGLVIGLTLGGSSFASQPDGDANASTSVEDGNSDGAYLVATMALLGLAGLAGLTRRDYVRAHRRDRRGREPIETAPPPPPSTTAVTTPSKPIRER